jgi:transcriptional regulator with XRE-family HTH domain
VTLRLTLHELLTRENISVYRVAKEFERLGYSEENLYAIAKGRSRVSMESLEALLTALEVILGREVSLLEVVEQVREQNSGV